MTEAQTMLELADKLRSFSKEELIEELLGALQRAAAAAAQPVAWCQPMDCGKNTPRKFMIYFEDPDHGIMVFDNEVEARAAFDRKNTAWNCYLFGAMPLHVSASTIPADTQAMREALEKIIAVPTGYHAAAQMESIARAALAATGHRAGGTSSQIKYNECGHPTVDETPPPSIILAGAKALVDQVYHKSNAWDRPGNVHDDSKQDFLHAALHCWKAMTALMRNQ